MQGSVRTQLAALVAIVFLAPVAGAQDLARPEPARREAAGATAAPTIPSGDDAGTVIAVGGAIVGIYGLYLYLGAP